MVLKQGWFLRVWEFFAGHCIRKQIVMGLGKRLIGKTAFKNERTKIYDA